MEIACIIKTKWDLYLEGGVLIGNLIPENTRWITTIWRASSAGTRGRMKKAYTAITPFLLARIKEITKGVSFASNVQLAYNNARVAAKIAKELCKLS